MKRDCEKRLRFEQNSFSNFAENPTFETPLIEFSAYKFIMSHPLYI